MVFDVTNLVKKAREAAKKRNFGYAIELFKQVVLMDPNHLEGRRELREVEIKRCQEEGRSPTGGGLKSLGRVAKIKTLGARKKWEDQARECEEYLEISPRDPKMIYTLGVALQRMGSTDAAVQEYEDVVHMDPSHIDALSNLGLIFEERGDFPKAISFFEQVIKTKPHDQVASKKIRDLAAKNTIQVGRMEDTEDFRKKLKDKDRATKLESQTHLLRTEEDIDAAIELALEKAKANPDDSDFLRKVAELYRRKKDYKSAEEYYGKALNQNPQDFFAKEAIDDMKISQMERDVGLLKKKLTEAGDEEVKKKHHDAKVRLVGFQIEAYTRRVQDHPTDPKLRFELGKFLYTGNQINEAIAAFQKTVEDPKLRSDSHRYLGLCFRLKRTFDLAIRQFEQARADHHSFNDKAKQITYDLAKTYLQKKDKAKAQGEFEKIFAVDINFRDVAQIMDELTREDGGES